MQTLEQILARLKIPNPEDIHWDAENPVITCLMSVYNGETYLREAMDSILAQTFTDFEFLIINDGSTDETVAIIESYEDPRIRLVHNEENMGLTKSLNKGLDLARGKYIARMDADDVSLPERFERQVNHLKKNEILTGCASNAWVCNASGDIIENISQPDNWRTCGSALLYSNVFTHSSILLKASVFKDYKYDSEITYAQDYELWLRLFTDGYTMENVKTNLVVRRNHGESIEHSNRPQQLKTVKDAFEKHFTRFKSLITCAVLSHNKVDQTLSCVSKVVANGVNVLILDNDSSSFTKHVLKIYASKNPLVKIIWSEKNLGVGVGRNHQIEAIESPYILFLDNDIQISEHFFFKLYKEYLRSSDADGWVVRLFNVHQGFYQAHYKLTKVGNSFQRQALKNGFTNMFMGGACLINKEVFDRVGFYDEHIFVGYEDYELAIRAMRNGQELKIYALQETECLHTHLTPLLRVESSSIKKRYDVEINQFSIDYINQKHGIELKEKASGYIDGALKEFERKAPNPIKRWARLLDTAYFNAAFYKLAKSIA